MKKIWYPALLAGFLLYLMADLCVCLTCFDLPDSVFSTSLTATFVLGTIITIILFIRHRTSMKHQLLSGLILQIAFWLLFFLDAFVGITRSFVPFTDDNYAAGLILLIFWLFFSGISVIGFICTAVARFIRKLIRTK